MNVRIPFQTKEGLRDLANLDASDFTVGLLGGALAKTNRFNGRTPYPVSVAMHSVLVSRLCPPHLAAWGLLHDAHEAFLGDITTPALDLLCLYASAWTAGSSAFRHVVIQAKQGLDQKIGKAWGVEPRWHDILVQQADRAALHAEMAVFMGAFPDYDTLPDEDVERIERAISILGEIRGVVHEWRADRALWIDTARDYARKGMLRLPAGAETPEGDTSDGTML